jgi:hypothetical protein
MPDYIRDLQPAKWGTTINLRCKNVALPMSLMGQKATSAGIQAMSALTPISDID